MSKFIHSDNLTKYYRSLITPEFASLSPEQMLNRLINDIPTLDSTPAEVRQVYTSRDVQEIRRYLISLIHDLTDDWTDFNESDIGVALVELLAGVADMQGFYLDKQALECYITDVKQRKNGAAILKLINYNMHMMSSSLTQGRFTLPQIYDQPIVIPKYTQVSATLSNREKIYFATAKEIVIDAGETEADVTLVQGQVHKASIKIADLRSNQKVKIATENVAEGSVIIEMDGFEWTQVPDVLIDDVPGPKFSVYEDKNCQAYIHFHNSYLDYLPTDNSSVANVTFLVTLGKAGQITDGLIDKVESDIMYLDQSISRVVEVINLEPSSGGSDRETLDEAREQAPKSLSMLGKAIILQDFEDMANAMQGVLKCKALDWSVEGEYVSEPYIIKLYVIPTDDYRLSNAQAEAIVDYFKDKKVNYQTVQALEPSWHLLNLDVVVDAYVSDSNKDYLKSAITDAIKEGLSPANLDFGMTLLVSDIKSIIRSASDSIVSVDIANLDDNIYLRLNEFIKLMDIQVTINAKKTSRQRIS